MSRWSLLCTEGPLAGRHWTLSAAEPLQIGRAPGNHIAIPNAVLSRHHARICNRDGVLELEDLGSRNGTQLNGRRVASPASLQPGDRLVFGEHAFILLGAEDAPASAEPPETPPAASLRRYVHLPSGTIAESPAPDSGAPPARWLGIARLREDPFSRSYLQVGDRRFQWKQALFYATALASVLAGLVVFGRMFIQPVLALRGEPLTIGVSMALASLAWLPLLHLVNRTGKNHPLLLILLVLWGATIALCLSLVASRFLPAHPTAGLGPLLVFSVTAGPLAEEAVKALALVLLMACLYDEFTNSIDGMILGMAVGLGFAIGENVLYFTSAAIGGRDLLLSLFLLRSPLLPTVCHPAWTALVGYGLGVAREKKWARHRWLYPLGGFLLAATCHGLWNLLSFTYQSIFHRLTTTFLLLLLTIGLLVIVMLAVLFWLALQKERAILVRYLAPLLDSRVLAAEEFVDLLNPGRFYRGLARTMIRQGWRTAALRLRLYRGQLQLAYRKWHLDTGDRFKGIHFDRLEMSILERIVETRKRLAD